MSKILLFTDNHFCTYSSIMRSRGIKYSIRLENQIKSLNWINDLGVEKNCDKIICLGDFFDSASLTSEELSALKEIRWNDIPKLFIVGNHEMGNNDLSFNSVNALSKVGTVIDKPTLLGGYGYELLLLPYILEDNRKSIDTYFNEAYEGTMTTCEVKNRIILSHNDLAGLQLGKYISKTGFDINDIDKNCALFINGHLHNQTQISEKIINLGNLTGQNFSEDGFKYSHCAAILDTDSLKVELINNPYAVYFYKIAGNKDEIIQQIQKCSKEYAIGTIKVAQKDYDEIQALCLQHFKEFRLITIPDISIDKQMQVSAINKCDHIDKFKEYMVQILGSSDIVLEELSRIEQN